MRLLRNAFTERNLVIILFVMVFAAFAFAQKESKKIEKLYLGFRIQQSFPGYTSSDKVATPNPEIKNAQKNNIYFN